MKKHPIFNSSCTHYDNESKPAILQMQERMSLEELRNYCVGNVYEYELRLGKKQGESEEENLKKQETYKYAALLYTLMNKFGVLEEERELLFKIYHAKITEEEIKEYLAKPKHYAGDKEIYMDSLKELLEYLLRS